MTPAAGEIVVAVRAAGLNRADYLESQFVPDAVVGRELAGEVVAVGADVRWVVGDRVMALGPGFSTEPVTIAADVAMPVPASFSWEEAATLPLALATTHDALATRGQLTTGDRALVHAATSGIGMTGVRVAALLGASVVYATSRSAAKLDALRAVLGELGCDLIFIDTSVESIESVASDVDVILDTVGASVLAGNMAAAAIEGRIVQVGRLGGSTVQIDLDALANKRLSLIGVTFRTRTPRDVAELVRRALADLEPHLESLRPHVYAVWPRADLDQALEALGRDEHLGKLVVVSG